MAEFEDQRDKEHVIKEEPCNFDKNLIILKEFEGGQQVCNISITKALFFIRVYDLPLMARK